jgi:holo-[acyl-carrier protein] synthase
VKAPLPLPADASVVGVGIDVVGVARMRTALTRTPGLATRVFSSRERDAADAHADTATRLASSFAVKEAVVKSLGVGLSDVTMREIELLDDERGSGLVVGGRVGVIAGARGVVSWVHRVDETAGRVVAVVVARG